MPEVANALPSGSWLYSAGRSSGWATFKPVVLVQGYPNCGRYGPTFLNGWSAEKTCSVVESQVEGCEGKFLNDACSTKPGVLALTSHAECLKDSACLTAHLVAACAVIENVLDPASSLKVTGIEGVVVDLYIENTAYYRPNVRAAPRLSSSHLRVRGAHRVRCLLGPRQQPHQGVNVTV